MFIFENFPILPKNEGIIEQVNSENDTPTPDPEAAPTPNAAENPATEKKAPAPATKNKGKDSRKVDDATTPSDEVKPARKTDNSNMYSARMPPKWFDLVEIVTAKHPDKKIGDALSATLERGLEKEDEAEITATVHQHPTLNGAEYIRIRGELASVLKIIKSFRADLLQIDQYPDDTERNEGLAKLFTTTEETLEDCLIVARRLGRIALLPEIPSGDDFKRLHRLKSDLSAFRKEATDTEDRAIYTLALKLIAPFLP